MWQLSLAISVNSVLCSSIRLFSSTWYWSAEHGAEHPQVLQWWRSILTFLRPYRHWLLILGINTRTLSMQFSQHRIGYKVSVLTYKTLNTSVPRYLSQRINRRVNARTRRTHARRLRHCSSNRSLVSTSRNVLSMRHAVCLELTSCVCHRKRLTVCFQI